MARVLTAGPAAALANPAGRATAWFFAALFMAIGAHMPFWPIWLKDWGLSETETGFYMGLGIAARPAMGVLAPWLADLTGRRRTALMLLAGLAFITFAAHAVVETRGLLLALTIVSMVSLAGCTPIGDALAAASARRHGFDYAPVRAVGSAAFLFASLACGWAVARWGSDAALVWVLASVLALGWFSARHPGGARGQDPKPRLADVGRLLRSPAFLLAAVASAALQASHAPLYVYGSLDWRAQGIDEGSIGALWAVGVAAEIAFMVWLGARAAARLGAAGLFLLSGAFCVLRWGLMMLEPSLPWLWALQLLHACTFAAAHLGLIAFVSAAAPPGIAASAQGLIGSGLGGLAMAGATLTAAALHDPMGPLIHGIGLSLGLVGIAAALLLARRWQGEPL